MNAFLTISEAKSLDSSDPLRSYREMFHIPKWNKQDCIYLTGNSLGLQPKGAKKAVLQELEDWKVLGVEGHFKAKNPWMPYHEFFSQSIARLCGSLPEEVVSMGSLTANLHFAFASFYRPTKDRQMILCEKKAFPSDRYAIVSQLELHGYGENELIEVAGSDKSGVPDDDEILKAIEKYGDQISVLLIGGVNYFTGRLYDIKKITEAAKIKGINVGWDLAHAMGNTPLSLNKWNVDFAAWCTYKYLNAGPGSTAGLFIHKKHHEKNLPKYAGWWGHNKSSRFKMGTRFDPIKTAEAWQVSNAPVLSMASLRASLDIFDLVPFEQLRNKSLLLSNKLIQMLDDIKNKTGEEIEIITPREDSKRGGQVSVHFVNRDRVFFEKISNLGVFADWREPGTIRMAIAPLYNSFEDISRLEKVIYESLEK